MTTYTKNGHITRANHEYEVGQLNREIDRLKGELKRARNVASNRFRQICKMQEQLSQKYPWEPELDHVGLHAFRITALTPERIYLEEWQKENEREPAVNHGRGALECILTEQVAGFPLGGGGFILRGVSQRDAEVAASVVQWLATNCGGAFLARCEKRIKEETKFTPRSFARSDDSKAVGK